MKVGKWLAMLIVAVLLLSVLAVPAVGQSTGLTPKNGKYFVVGWTPMNDPLNEYWKAFDNGLKDAITIMGGQMLYCSPQGDAVKQNDCVDQFLTQNVDAIAVYPLDASAIGSAIKKANDANVPVFSFTGEVPTGTGAKVALSVNVDDRTAGQMAGEALVKALTAKNGKPAGKVLEVQGLMTMSAGQNRGGGFHDVVDKYPDIKVTAKPGDWDTGKATTAIQDWITANPDTDAIYFHSDGAYTPAAKAALSAIKKWVPAGEEGHVILVGEDGTNQAVNAIKCGYMEQTGDFALADISPLLGSLMMDYLKTGAMPKVGDMVSRPNTLWKEAKVIEKEGISGPLVYLPIYAITKDTATNPDLFANKYQGAPNGLSECAK